MMTIAISVVVKPSKLLVSLLAALCLGVVGVGVSVGCGLIGDSAVWFRAVCAAACILAAAAGFFRMLRKRKSYHLDISGMGQIRLRLIDRRPNARRVSDTAPHEGGMLVRLLADSTLWPHFMLLRLQDDTGQVYALSVLPDSLPSVSFRALAVACRWIAAHRFSELN